MRRVLKSEVKVESWIKPDGLETCLDCWKKWMAGDERDLSASRMTFPRMAIDKLKCERLVQCAKRYRRSVNQQTNEPGPPLHDEFSHGADNLRYIAVNAESMTNEDWGAALKYQSLGII